MTELTITEFLLARVAEDEEAALTAAGDYLPAEFGAWEVDELWDDAPWEVVVYPERGGSTTIARTWRSEEGRRTAAHIARHDPARVLAECAAKRRIVQAEPVARVAKPDAPLVEASWSGRGPVHVRIEGSTIEQVMTHAEYRAFVETITETAPPSQTLRLLALPHADHPDYREEWKP